MKEERLELNVSRAEVIASQRIRQALAATNDGAPIAESPAWMEALTALEFFFAEVIEPVSPFWRWEGFDSVAPAWARKAGASQLELAGLVLLVTDQAWTPFHCRLALALHTDSIDWIDLRVGAPGDGIGGIKRIPYGSRRESKEHSLAGESDRTTAWVFVAERGTPPR